MMDGLENRVRLAVLSRAIDTTVVPSAAELAAELSLPESRIADAYRVLADGHVYVLEPTDPTRLRMANPFSAVPTAFSVATRGRVYFGNCIWDSLGIVSLLGGDGIVETACPDCREPLVLRISGRRLVAGEGVVHFSVPARHWWDDIIYT
jgi:Alkylmercury lyase